MANFLKVPRIIISMCDDLRVKCPFSSEGCREIIERGHIQAHVKKYCDYRLLPCPAEGCRDMTRKKDMDPDGRCLHELRGCENCEELVMEQDFEAHTTELCSSLKADCADCGDSMCRNELEKHLETCPEVKRSCLASKFGCPVKLKMADLGQHEQSCPLATLGPYLETQSSRIESMEATIKQLRQRNEILEDGITNIRSTIAHISPLQANPQSEVSPIVRSDSPVSLTSEIGVSGLPHNDAPNDTIEAPSLSTESTTNIPPSNATTYLLSIHESLREEVSQLSNAISVVDARATTTIMNEGHRLREDMAHITAGVNTIRMQVHWLMNPRLHQNRGPANGSATGNPSASDSARNLGMGGPSAGQSGHSSSPPPLSRGRRLSDGSREGTKL
ncbi:hypothetical protein FQN52_008674 [Onygenales sp. PD_12]|nr:hypothetical protein FQN52_008674 [Onygenales sp. PD_12]